AKAGRRGGISRGGGCARVPKAARKSSSRRRGRRPVRKPARVVKRLQTTCPQPVQNITTKKDDPWSPPAAREPGRYKGAPPENIAVAYSMRCCPIHGIRRIAATT